MAWKSILNLSVWKTESTYKPWSDYTPFLVTGLSPISYYRTEPEHEEAGPLPLSPCTSSARVALEKQGLCLLGRERCAARAGGGPGCERCRPCGRGSRGGGGAGRERAGGRAGGRAGAGRGGPRPPAPFVRRPPSLSAGRPWLRGRRWARARGSAPGPRPPARAARRRSRGAKAQVAADGLGTRVCSLRARCGGWVSRTGAVAGVPRCDLGEGRGGSWPRSVREAQALYWNSGIPPTGTGGCFPMLWPGHLGVAQVYLWVVFQLGDSPLSHCGQSQYLHRYHLFLPAMKQAATANFVWDCSVFEEQSYVCTKMSILS